MTKQNFDQGEPRESFIRSYAPVLAFVAGVALLGHYQPFDLDSLVNGRSKQEKKEERKEDVPKNSVVKCLDDVLDLIDKKAYEVSFEADRIPEKSKDRLSVIILPLNGPMNYLVDIHLNYDRNLVLYKPLNFRFEETKDFECSKFGITLPGELTVTREYEFVSDGMDFRLIDCKRRISTLSGHLLNVEEFSQVSNKIDLTSFDDGFDHIKVGSELKVKEKYDKIREYFLSKLENTKRGK